ncbi:MAG: serine/threonine protein phosphatase, partial [Saprospiraceae bacterium]|nr:serine/threonine protein phosphatase [Saprospiraceae bacterium]
WDFMEKTLPYYRIDPYIFVHAGLEYDVPLENQDDNFLYWRKFFVPEPYAMDARVICGHTARKNGEIANFGHTICIDTYAYGGMWLTCLNVETKEFLKSNEMGEIEKGTL